MPIKFANMLTLSLEAALIASAANAAEINLVARAGSAVIGTFALDPTANVVSYDFGPAPVALDKQPRAVIHGYAPMGYDTVARVELDLSRSLRGMWRYPETEERNILDGLAYVVVTSRRGIATRAQITRQNAPAPIFPSEPVDMLMKGGCHLLIDIPQFLQGVKAEMEPATVRMHLGSVGDHDGDGLRDVPLSIDVRKGGGYVPGLGHVEVQVVGDANVGEIEASSTNASALPG